MAKVEEIKVLNIDGVPYAVESMSDEIKQMVEVFNGWAVKEADIRDDLMMVIAAKNDLSRQIIMKVRQEQEESKNDSEETDTTTEESSTLEESSGSDND